MLTPDRGRRVRRISVRNAERFFIGVAWLMGITMIAIGAAHVIFVTTDLHPADGDGSGRIPLIGEVPVIWMVLGWELPTAVLIIGGLKYQSRNPGFSAVLVILGVISFGVHLWYLPIVPVLSVLMLVAVFARSRRLVIEAPACLLNGGAQ